MARKHAALLPALLVSACWADFPASRLQQGRDASSGSFDAAVAWPDAWLTPYDAGVRVDSRSPLEDASAVPDAAVPELDSAAVTPDAQLPDSTVVVSCTPGRFVACSSNNRVIELCRGVDLPNEEVRCIGGLCDAELQRCTTCDPEQHEPQCTGFGDRSLEICTSLGLLEQISCSGVCPDACCRDADGDGQTNCGGDCNDEDADVFVGQLAFFEHPDGRGSFDYNCDYVEEPSMSGLWVCEAKEEVWRWVERIPACGETGQMNYGGKLVGGECVPLNSRQVQVNECR